MAYSVTQINDLEQFGELNTTFILIDDAGIMPEVRIDKTFKINAYLDKILENNKKLTCLFYENEFLNSLEIKEEIQE